MEDDKKVCGGSTLTINELKSLKKKICESLSYDRHQLLCQFPFIGNLLMRMELVPVRDRRCMTAATDGATIYFNISFYSKLSTQEREFVLAHELFHCVLLHLTRCQTRIPDVYNIASDMEVNYCLSQQGGDMLPPKNLCFPPKSMQGKSAEVIYEWLMRKFKQQKKNGKCPSSPSDACDEQYDESRSSKQCMGQDKNGESSGNLEGQFDNHTFDSELDKSENAKPASDEDRGCNETGEVSDEYGIVGYDPDFTPRISKDFADKMREAVIAEAQRCQRTQGHLPAGLDAILKSLPKPEVSWQDHLAAFVSSSYGDKRKWCPPNRRHLYEEIYFQSRRSEKIKVAVLVDTSGSCWGDLSKFFSEINSLLKTFGSYEMTVVQCDADVHSVIKYDNETPFPIDDPKSIDITGCGGSDFRPGFKRMLQDGIENDVDCIIAFTDGYINFPTYPPSKPILIILTNDGNRECCSWGKKIVFKDNSYKQDEI